MKDNVGFDIFYMEACVVFGFLLPHNWIQLLQACNQVHLRQLKAELKAT